jgi:acyl-CoA thioesterase FadM
MIAMVALGADTELLMGSSPVSVRRRAKWGECDPAGVVYMVNYAEYVVSAYEMLMTILFDERLGKIKARHGIALPAKAFTIEFYASLHPDDDFLMTVEVVDIRSKSFDVMVRGTSNEGDDIFVAKLTLVTVDPNNRSALPMPDTFARKLHSYRSACVLKDTSTKGP